MSDAAMSGSIEECFVRLLGELTPGSGQERRAEDCLGVIAEVLVPRFEPVRLERVGSFGHGTEIRERGVLDVVAVVPAERLKINSDATLRVIAEALRASPVVVDVALAPPGVVVRFGNGQADACSIIPAELAGRTTDGAEIYLIPDRAGGWMRSAPQAYRAWVDAGDDRLGGRLKPLVRIMKAWSSVHRTGLRSTWIELRTAQWAAERGTIDYPNGVRDVLRQMLEYAHAMPDPLDVGAPIEACPLSAHTASFAAVAIAAELAEQACEATAAGRSSEAHAHWQRVFDGYFPPFG